MKKSIIFLLLILSIVALFFISGCQKGTIGQKVSVDEYQLKGTWNNARNMYTLGPNEKAISLEGENRVLIVDKEKFEEGITVKKGEFSCIGSCICNGQGGGCSTSLCNCLKYVSGFGNMAGCVGSCASPGCDVGTNSCGAAA